MVYFGAPQKTLLLTAALRMTRKHCAQPLPMGAVADPLPRTIHRSPNGYARKCMYT